LTRSFFARPSVEVAPALLGRTLARCLPDGSRLAGRIVEVEAYEPGDPASHGSRRRTAFNDRMFGPPGRLYVYFTYGHHWMMNVVTGEVGVASAVLLRAVEPLEGTAEMAMRRGRTRLTDLCSGPGKLCQALGVTRSDDGSDLVRGSNVWIEAGTPVRVTETVRGIRVGVSSGLEREWRFYVRDDPFVSRGRPGPPSRKGRQKPGQKPEEPARP
jgi:DNA-3-methyladenine glycosylase